MCPRRSCLIHSILQVIVQIMFYLFEVVQVEMVFVIVLVPVMVPLGLSLSR